MGSVGWVSTVWDMDIRVLIVGTSQAIKPAIRIGGNVLVTETIFGVALVLGCLTLVYRFMTDAIDRMQMSVKARQDYFHEQFKERQEQLDKQFNEQAARLFARDKEIDLLIEDINKRVSIAMSNAVAQFVQPYQELQEEFQGKGVAAHPQTNDIFTDVSEDDLRMALDKLEAGIL